MKKARHESGAGAHGRTRLETRALGGLVSLFRRAVSHDAARFLAAGGLAAAVNWISRFPLSALMPFEAAVSLAFVIGMSVGFGLYRTWVFPGSRLPLQAQVPRFLAVNAVGALVVLAGSIGLLRLFLALGVQTVAAEGLAHGLAIGLGAVVNYAGHRTLTFARRGTAEATK